MKELEFLEIINKTLSNTSLLGDDCAYLEEFGLCITQDTLVEGVHFLLSTISPRDLGKKAVNINLSDLAASGSEPRFLTISLSLPNSISREFIEEFYKGVNDIVVPKNVVVAGGDLTAGEKFVISICAIGKKYNNVRVGRAYAKPNDVIATTGFHGDSGAGLKLLLNNDKTSNYLINKHLAPVAQNEKSQILMQVALKNGLNSFAMMDSSDGLGDAIYKLSKGSGYDFEIDYSSIPVSDELKKIFPKEWQKLAMWGGEDFELVFCMPQSIFDKLNKKDFHKIGVVSNKHFSNTLKTEFEKNIYKHFE